MKNCYYSHHFHSNTNGSRPENHIRSKHDMEPTANTKKCSLHVGNSLSKSATMIIGKKYPNFLIITTLDRMTWHIFILQNTRMLLQINSTLKIIVYILKAKSPTKQCSAVWSLMMTILFRRKCLTGKRIQMVSCGSFTAGHFAFLALF